MASPGETVRRFLPALALSASLGSALVAGPAAAQQAGVAEVDPWETLNRGAYGFNHGLDKVFLGPLAHAYMAVVPKPVRGGVHNILLNLDEPTTFVNRVLQLRLGRAGKTAVRFAVNSTLGIGGAFDVADRGGLPRDPTDFGQTLARYGAVPGPYVFVPILGPSTVRDSFGKTVDLFTSPLNWTQINRYPPNLYIRFTLLTLDLRAQADPILKDVEANATDPYATLRSLYLQNRESLVSGGELKVEDLPDFDPAPESAPATPPPESAPAPAPVAEAAPEAAPAFDQAVLSHREYELLH